MLLTSPMHVREAEHCSVAQDVARFLARGGQIERLPIGLMRETTARQRINPSSAPKAERDAAARAARAIPAPRARVRKPRRPARVRTLVREASQQARVITELLQGPVSASFLAGAVGTNRNSMNSQLYALRERDIVRAEGPRHALVWMLTPKGRLAAQKIRSTP